jgi:hypothetical protein
MKKPYCEWEEQEMLDKAKQLLDTRGLSGTTIDFLEHIIWHGFSDEPESSYFQYRKMREILTLYPLS